MNDDEIRETAVQRAESKLGFYVHLFVYVAVNGLLAWINLSGSREQLWFLWPLIGWGVGVLFHAVFVFLMLKSRMVAREIERQKQQPAAG